MLGSNMEYFDGTDWRSISSYKDGYALQYSYNGRLGTSSLVKPTFFCKSTGDLYKLGNDDFCCLHLEATGDNKVVYFDNDGLAKLDIEECLMYNDLEPNSRLFDLIPVTFPMEDSSLSSHLSDDVIKDIVFCLNTGNEGKFVKKFVNLRWGSYLEDSIYGIDADSRKRLFSAMGIHPNEGSLFCVKNLRLASTLCTLWNMTYTGRLRYIELNSVDDMGDIDMNVFAVANTCDYSDVGSIKCGVRKPFFSERFGVSEVKGRDCYKLEVPSGMLVVRMGGNVPSIPFVVGC